MNTHSVQIALARAASFALLCMFITLEVINMTICVAKVKCDDFIGRKS